MSTTTAEQWGYADPSSVAAYQAPAVDESARVSDGYQRISTETALRMGRLQAWYDVRSSLPLVVADMAMAASAAALAAAAGHWAGESVPAWFVLGVVAMTLLLQHSQSLYPACGTTYSIEFRRVLKSCFLVCAGTAIGLLFAAHSSALPWTCWIVLCITLTLLLSIIRPIVRRLLATSTWWTQPVLVIGSGERAARLFERLQQTRNEGLRPVGIVFDQLTHWTSSLKSGNSIRSTSHAQNQWQNSAMARAIVDRAGSDQKLHIGPISALEEILGDAKACRVVVADANRQDMRSFQSFHGIPHVTVPVQWDHYPTESVRIVEADGQIEMHCRTNLTCPHALLAKRWMDLLLVVSTSPIWVPVILLIGLMIRVFDPGPVFYRQMRVGRYRQPFLAIKFRSMVCDADQKLAAYLDAHPELRAEWAGTHKLKNDPRITRLGAFLRKTSLDELPQLLNVLVGEMSLVGPRPIIDCGDYDREYIEQHPKVFRMYQMVRPGITGLWQVSGRNGTSYQQRIHFDRIYLHNWTLGMDIFILWRTIKTAIFREGAC